MASAKSKEEAMKKIRDDFASFTTWIQQRDSPQFDGTIMAEARLVDASSSGKAVFELDVGTNYSNLRGTMHGAAAALIFDNLSSAAFLPLIPSAEEQRKFGRGPPGGVTRSLNISYLRPCPTPSVVRVESWVVQHGRSASLVHATISSTDGKTLYFTCEHHKIAAPTQIKGPASGTGNQRKIGPRL